MNKFFYARVLDNDVCFIEKQLHLRVFIHCDEFDFISHSNFDILLQLCAISAGTCNW